MALPVAALAVDGAVAHLCACVRTCVSERVTARQGEPLFCQFPNPRCCSHVHLTSADCDTAASVLQRGGQKVGEGGGETTHQLAVAALKEASLDATGRCTGVAARSGDRCTFAPVGHLLSA